MPDRLLFISGHRTDEIGRPNPRFPESQVPLIRDDIAHFMNDLQVGPGWTVVTGGTRGADLIAAEEGLSRRANVHLCLALPPGKFLTRSVHGGTNDPVWERSFAQVCDRATVNVLPESATSWRGGSVYAQANDWMISNLAAAEQAHALLVWDGTSGQSGGTGEVALDAFRIVRRSGGTFHIVDPTPRPYAARESSQGPKKILALTGGGLRGVISLEVLVEIESQLRTTFDQPSLVLSDYFDYIAGTSTGAIIATALALGQPVQEIRDRYHQLGKLAFRRSISSLPHLARFGATGITEQLQAFFGENLTLGDRRLQSLLLIVLHRIDSDSAWLLSNCTGAKYNKTTRLMTDGGADRNLDLPLVKLVRGSTAAPTYFPPETVQVGAQTVTFQDGGVTAFNNPALIAAVMATVPAYGLSWPTGPRDLLVVSVGTGVRAQTAARRTLQPLESLANLGRLPMVLMNGSAFSQDLLCRVMGDCRFGPPLDNEVGSLTGQLFPPHDDAAWQHQQQLNERVGIPAIGQYFAYVHYDSNLAAEGLEAAGIPTQDWSKVTAMDNYSQIPNWQLLGAMAAADVIVEDHFADFLGPKSPGL